MKTVVAVVLGLTAIASVGCVSKFAQSLPGRYVLVSGGYSERLVLNLKEDSSYTLWHAVDFHDIAGEDRGLWALDGNVVTLMPKVHGAADGDKFLPYYCARLRVQKRGSDVLLVSESVPLIPAATRERAVLGKQAPNKSPEPTSGSVTPRASSRTSK
jgi:hypothetical protein